MTKAVPAHRLLDGGERPVGVAERWQRKEEPLWATALWQDTAARLERLFVKVRHADAHVAERRATEEDKNNPQVDKNNPQAERAAGGVQPARTGSARANCSALGGLRTLLVVRGETLPTDGLAAAGWLAQDRGHTKGPCAGRSARTVGFHSSPLVTASALSPGPRGAAFVTDLVADLILQGFVSEPLLGRGPGEAQATAPRSGGAPRGTRLPVPPPARARRAGEGRGEAAAPAAERGRRRGGGGSGLPRGTSSLTEGRRAPGTRSPPSPARGFDHQLCLSAATALPAEGAPLAPGSVPAE